MIITSNHVTKQIAGAFVVKQVHDLWNALEWYSRMLCYTGSYVYHFESRRQLMGQTVYKSDVGYRSILLYLFQLNYNYKSAFVMSNTFQRTFQHLVRHAHPTIYNFLSAVHLEQASTEGKMHSYRRGVEPPKRKRRYLEKNTRLKHIVSTYHTYENNVAAYVAVDFCILTCVFL